MNTLYHIAPKRSGHAFVRRMLDEWLPDVYIEDHENGVPSHFTLTPRDVVIVLQTWDLLNWLASYAMSYLRRNKMLAGSFTPDTVDRRVRLWLRIAREWYGVTPHLRGHRVVRVYYDRFFSSGEYRRQVCRELGGEYSERSLNRVRDNGRGSSFDGTGYDGRGQSMDVLTRYRQLPEVVSGVYRYVFTRRPELLEFYVRYQLPGIDKLRFLHGTVPELMHKRECLII